MDDSRFDAKRSTATAVCGFHVRSTTGDIAVDGCHRGAGFLSKVYIDAESMNHSSLSFVSSASSTVHTPLRVPFPPVHQTLV